MMHRRHLFCSAFGSLVAAAAWIGEPVLGQPIYSIDFHGPTLGTLDAIHGVPITEGDLLIAAPFGYPGPGTTSLPGILVFAGGVGPGPTLGLPMYDVSPPGPTPGYAGFVEVDALSFGNDFLLTPDSPFAGVWTFSVTEFVTGFGPMLPGSPHLRTQGAAGAQEASADIFVSYAPPGMFPPGPLAPDSVPRPGNAVMIDGNGLSPPPVPHPSLSAIVGFGLVEPNPPTVMPISLPDPGDNIDALDVDTVVTPGNVPYPIYFSLDTSYFDTIEGDTPPGMGPVNSGSASLNGGFSGADILVILGPGEPPMVYASAEDLGLDFLGFDTDDVNAIVLHENGIPGYQPAQYLYDWGPGRGDMLLFSLRYGSGMTFVPDGIYGIPIDSGDILVPPMGSSPLPGIFIAAENLGLSASRTPSGGDPDDLNALDVSPDCNFNGIPDRLDVLPPPWPARTDCNGNFIPDECETLTCGDGFCCPPETLCSCPEDCGPVPDGESDCENGLDDDCDDFADCDDPDCMESPACQIAGVPTIATTGLICLSALVLAAGVLMIRFRANLGIPRIQGQGLGHR
jgi:hypothetical protein